MLIRSTVLGFGEQGILLAQALVELNYASSSLPAPPHSPAGSASLSPGLTWAPINAVPLDFLVHTASH